MSFYQDLGILINLHDFIIIIIVKIKLAIQDQLK